LKKQPKSEMQIAMEQALTTQTRKKRFNRFLMLISLGVLVYWFVNLEHKPTIGIEVTRQVK
jgi:hypothetical protein